MHIIYDHQAFTRQFFGGVSRYFVELVRRLAVQNDISVSVLAPLYINHYLDELSHGIVQGRRVQKAPKAAGKLFNIYNRIIEKNFLDKNTIHLLHETYYSSKPAPVGGNVKTVLTVYDMIHEKFPGDFHKWDRTAHNKRLAMNRADHIICISETTRKDLLEEYHINPEKVSVIHLGFMPGPAEASNNSSLIDGQYILYVGNRTGYKNFDRLLKAYASNEHLHNNFRLVCFGGGKPGISEYQAARSLGLDADRVIWMAGSDKVLSSLYSSASAFVYPSLYEGFGIPPLEAMAHDCPVICSHEGSITEVVGDAGEYFNPYKEHDIASTIERVLSDDDLAARLRDSGRNRLSMFTWDKCAKETLKLYNNLTEQVI